MTLNPSMLSNADAQYYEERNYDQNYYATDKSYEYENKDEYGYDNTREYGYENTGVYESDDYTYDRDKAFVTKMAGQDQIPPNGSPAFGFAKVTIEKNPVSYDKELWYKVSLFDVPRGDDINAIHIHKITNPDGSGPHIITLCGNPLNEIASPEGPGIVVAGAATQNDIEPNSAGIETIEQFIQAMKDGETYVNVHSTDFNNEGEIRGY